MAGAGDRRLGISVGALCLAAGVVVVPGLASPFLAPRSALLGAAALSATVLVASRRTLAAPGGSAWLLAWPATAALAAFVGDLTRPGAALQAVAAGLLAAALARLRPAPGPALTGLALGGAADAAVVLAQAAGLDPFTLAGLAPAAAGDRLRLYGTSGNPDFAAALIVPALVAAVAEAAAAGPGRPVRRAALAVAALLCAAALVPLRSLATAPSLLAGGLAAAWALRAHRRALGAAAVLAVLAALAAAAGAAGRDLARAAEGRLHLVAQAVRHLADGPRTLALGHGPGAFVSLHAAWTRDDPTASTEARFAGPQDHVHCDPIEVLLESGIPGLLAMAGALALALSRALGTRPGETTEDAVRRAAIAAGIASLCARSLVDFPLHRPGELAVLAVLCGLAFGPARRKDQAMGLGARPFDSRKAGSNTFEK